MNQFSQHINKLIQIIIMIFIVLNLSGCTVTRLIHYRNHPDKYPTMEVREVDHNVIENHVETTDTNTMRDMMDIMTPKIDLLLLSTHRIWLFLPYRFVLSDMLWDPVYFWSWDDQYDYMVEFVLKPKWRKDDIQYYWLVEYHSGLVNIGKVNDSKRLFRYNNFLQNNLLSK